MVGKLIIKMKMMEQAVQAKKKCRNGSIYTINSTKITIQSSLPNWYTHNLWAITYGP